METTTKAADKYRFKYLGSVSHGTCNPEHLIRRFTDWLDSVKEDMSLTASGRELEVSNLVGRIDDLLGRVERSGNEDEQIELLFDGFNLLCPSGIYFGSHPGDGSDFGFWVCEGFAEEFDGFKSVKSLSDARSLGIETNEDDSCFPPDDYVGEWMHVNDHGNVTLYVRENGEDFEVWACV